MANLKFSQFTEQTDTSNVQFIVGYNGATNVRISPANIIGGTVTSVTTGNANTITIGGTSAAPTVAANTAAVTNGSANLATGDQIYDFVIAQGYTTNIGTVTSVGLAMPAAFSVASSPVTTSGTLTVTGAGTTAQYIRGDGTLNTFPTIPTVPTNIVETVTTTDGTFINLTPNTATDGAVTVTADLSATGTPSSSTYLRGDNTWAAISGGFTSFDITGGSGSAQTITNGNTVTLAQGTGISTVAGATDTVTITNTDRGSSQNIFKNVASDSGTAVADNNNDTLTITGGTNVSTAVVGDTLTITATDSGTPAILSNGSTPSLNSGISAAEVRTLIGAGTGNGNGTMSYWYISGDSGSNQIVTNTQIANFIGGTGISTATSSSDNLTINANVDGTQSVTANTSTTTAARTYKVQVDSSDNLVVNVPWASGGSYTPQVLTTSTTGQKDYLYILTGGSAITLTMPSSPSAGDSIKVSNLTTVNTCVIAQGGSNIMGLAQDMTLDNDNASFELIYTNATQGWVVVGATASA